MLVWIEGLVDGIGDWIGYILIGVFGGVAEFGRRLRQRGRVQDSVTDELDLDDDETRLDRHEDEIENLGERLDRQEQYFEGDPNDPSSPGVLQEVHDLKEGQGEVRQRIEENRQERKQEHREVVETLGSLGEKIDGGE